MPFDHHLAGLKSSNRLRRLVQRSGLDFCSNDYLALAGSADLKCAVVEALSRTVPIGSGGSRLLRGNHPEHELLEREAAEFFDAESALFCPTGFGANSMLVATLPQRGDLIIYDELIHASVHDGMRLSRAVSARARHNDLESFEHCLKLWREQGSTGTPWIIVESLYSMDGDQAPLQDLAEMADRYSGFLVIDEAHATGVFGPDGRGLSADLGHHQNIVTLHTCGKALGCEGALICGARTITEFLINRGRGFIYSTAPSPLMAAAVRQALKIIRNGTSRRRRLKQLVDFAAESLCTVGVRYTGSQILPLIIGETGPTVELADKLQQAGFDVRAIRPPTVPEGTSRLRISVTLNVDEADIAALANAIAELRH